MKSIFYVRLIVGILLFFSMDGWALTLKHLDATASSQQKVTLTLTFDGTAPKPHYYSIENPARIVLDFPNTMSNLEKYRDIAAEDIDHVITLQTAKKTRVIINLKKLPLYNVHTKDQFVFIVLGGDSSDDKLMLTQEEKPSNQDRSPVTVLNKPLNIVNHVDFSRNKEGAGNLTLDLNHKNALIDVKESGSRIIVQLENTQIASRWLNRLNVLDFATPVQTVDLKQRGKDGLIILKTHDHFEYLVYQNGKRLTVSVVPVQEKDGALENTKKEYTGEKITLNFQNIQIRAVLRIIADFTQKNLVASDTVAGAITLRLQDVPWDQALDLILTAKGLAKRENGNVILIAPAEEIAARERKELENLQKIQRLAPLYTEVFRINYHDADALFKLFEKDNNSPSILSKRGEVIVDTRSNSIILKETQDKLAEFRELLKVLDVPVRQVLIEARIVNADDGFSRSLGVKWSGASLNTTSQGATVIGGDNSNFSYDPEEDKVYVGGGEDGKLGSNVLTDLSVKSATAAQIAFGFIHNNTILNLELSAAESSSEIEIVSRPKVITSDKSTAIIKSGEEIPYEEASSSGATSTAFKTAALSLEVTPQITPDGRVIMTLAVNNDARGENTDAGPAINTQSISTQVLVNNGDTLVIGGVFDRRKEKTIDKVPFLGDLPVIGSLFRREVKLDNKRELLMFITPKILEDQFTTQYAAQ